MRRPKGKGVYKNYFNSQLSWRNCSWQHSSSITSRLLHQLLYNYMSPVVKEPWHIMNWTSLMFYPLYTMYTGLLHSYKPSCSHTSTKKSTISWCNHKDLWASIMKWVHRPIHMEEQASTGNKLYKNNASTGKRLLHNILSMVQALKMDGLFQATPHRLCSSCKTLFQSQNMFHACMSRIVFLLGLQTKCKNRCCKPFSNNDTKWTWEYLRWL